MRLLLLALTGLAFAACTHDPTWVVSKSKKGGVIGYPADSLFSDRDEVVADFAKKATTICKSGKYKIVKETIPAPASAAGAVGSAVRGDANGAVMSAGFAAMQDRRYRSHVMEGGSKVVYGNPFKSWNESEIRCQ